MYSPFTMSTHPIRKGKGRQKIEIKKIAHKGYLQVAFPRRRNDIFKKDSELATLCGAESAIIVFSPAGKPFSFGHPNVNTIIQRYLSNGMFPKDSSLQLIDFHQTANMNDLNFKFTKLTDELEMSKKRGEELKKLVSVYAEKLDIEKLDLQELEQLKRRLQGLQMEMGQRFDEILSTLPPKSDQFPMINNDMLFDDPYEFSYQANDFDAPNVVPQYYNFNYGDGIF